MNYKRSIEIKPGMTFDNWTVITKKKSKLKSYLCRCECGHEEVLLGSQLRKNKPVQCPACKGRYHDFENTNPVSDDGATTNRTGKRGIRWNRKEHLYEATVLYEGKKYMVGKFKGIDEAVKARNAAYNRMVNAH